MKLSRVSFWTFPSLLLFTFFSLQRRRFTIAASNWYRRHLSLDRMWSSYCIFNIHRQWMSKHLIIMHCHSTCIRPTEWPNLFRIHLKYIQRLNNNKRPSEWLEKRRTFRFSWQMSAKEMQLRIMFVEPVRIYTFIRGKKEIEINKCMHNEFWIQKKCIFFHCAIPWTISKHENNEQILISSIFMQNARAMAGESQIHITL